MISEDWTHDELLAALEWQIAVGVDETIDENPADSYALALAQKENAAKPRPSSQLPSAAAPKTLKPSPAKRALQSLQKTLAEAKQLADTAENLTDLGIALKSFDGCTLKKTAISTVFENQTGTAETMIIMGPPRADEDRDGKSVAGLNRKLLENMLKSIGLTLEKTYITSCVFWRPPGDKKPTTNDLSCCKPFIDRQIELVSPKVLILMGETTLRGFIDPDASLLRQRGKWTSYTTAGGTNTKTISTFAPHMLLNTPRQKALAWQDLRQIRDQLNKVNDKA